MTRLDLPSSLILRGHNTTSIPWRRGRNQHCPEITAPFPPDSHISRHSAYPSRLSHNIQNPQHRRLQITPSKLLMLKMADLESDRQECGSPDLWDLCVVRGGT